ncbi:kinase-like protein [Dothidotthia symphoricarpi CBS 119687]|uniref:Kinase-like protein n=1 Tax=Dothidotthia symphoricarpi CBS 119687 TaxID=1392245 RepID=A0A6A6A6S3_9PLEO|nr:kinase-like protein [Dothidotthia symphoricarpi CBS 119687]KAF2126895.1 kinase-like protein [Dothidotthia symphoricarpi CBS 119687]
MAVIQPGIKHSISRTTGEKYTPVALAGSGRHGDVWFCTSNTTPAALVALKVPRRSSHDELAREVAMLRAIQHHLTRTTTATMQKHFPHPIDYSARFLAVPPILGPSLTQLVSTAKTCTPRAVVPKSLVLHIARQLVDAVAFLHGEVSVCHRDLWEGNVMLRLPTQENQMPDVVLIDFGSAVEEPEGQRFAWERSCVYRMVERLGALHRRMDGGAASAEKDGVGELEDRDRFWNEFMGFLATMTPEKEGEEIVSFAGFREKFGISLDIRLGNVDVGEMREVGELLGRAVEMGEALPRLPGLL